MLIEFRTENHRSLRDEVAFTLEAGRIGHPGDPRLHTVEGHNKDLLSVAAIYGANASGKSNLLSALGFMRDAVIDSHTSWPPEGGTPRDAFAWGSRAMEPSMFEATVIIGGIRYQYGFSVDQHRVQEEWLFAWPRGRKQIWFERDGNQFSFGDKLRGENRVIEQVTRKNALFMSTAAQHRHVQLMPIYSWFRQLKTVRVEGYKERFADAMPAAVAAALFAAAAAASAASANTTNSMIRVSEFIPPLGKRGGSSALPQSLDETGVRALRHLLRAADVGITDFRIDRKQGGDNKEGTDQYQILMRHSAEEEDAWLPLEQESAGTRAVFQLGPSIFEALTHGELLVIDELESSLHPLVAAHIIDQFNNPKSNPLHAQLVFTTHDTTLLGTTLGEPSLRRDQIWLTEKNPEAATTLYPLTDYKPRKAENLERGYLQGRYGAIPYIDRLTQTLE